MYFDLPVLIYLYPDLLFSIDDLRFAIFDLQTSDPQTLDF